MNEYLYHYRVTEIISVWDGDTIRASVDCGFRMYAVIPFRLTGIDTPELRGDTYDAAVASRDYLKARLETAINTGRDVIIKSSKPEKYGRWLGTIYVDGVDINQELLDLGLAEAYDG